MAKRKSSKKASGFKASIDYFIAGVFAVLGYVLFALPWLKSSELLTGKLLGTTSGFSAIEFDGSGALTAASVFNIFILVLLGVILCLCVWGILVEFGVVKSKDKSKKIVNIITNILVGVVAIFSVVSIICLYSFAADIIVVTMSIAWGAVVFCCYAFLTCLAMALYRPDRS